MPASRNTPSSTFAIASGVASRPKPCAPLAPANTSVRPVAPFSRSCSACDVGLRGIGMVDPLHDLPGRRGGAAGDRRGVARARIDRLDLQAVIGLADQFLERRALQHAVDQLAPVRRRSPARNRPRAAGRRLQMTFGRSLPGRHVDCGRKLPRGGRQAKRLFRAISGGFAAVRRGRATARYPAVGQRSPAPPRRVRPAMSTVGRDLGQRHQHEGALEQPRMRQRQFRLVERDVVIGDQIEVEGARTPALSRGRGRGRISSRSCAA